MVLCGYKIRRQVTSQTVLQNTPHDKCDKERTTSLYAEPKCQALRRSLGAQRFKRLCFVCEQMDRADTGMHQRRDENGPPYVKKTLAKLVLCFAHQSKGLWVLDRRPSPA